MITLPHPLESFALARPHHPALLTEAEALSASALRDAVAHRAAELLSRGIGAGDRVALDGAPSAAWVIDALAVGWIGAAVVPLPPHAPHAEKARLLAAATPCRTLEAPLRAPRPIPPERDWPLDEVRALIFTSGSTGEPRPVPLTTAQLIFSAVGSAVRVGHAVDDRWLCCLPLHHVGGFSILIRAQLFNTAVRLMARFDAQAAAGTLDTGEITLVSLVPAMLERILDARPARPFPPRLRAILLGGEAAPPALLDRCRAIGAPVALTFGMTEAASQIATRAPGDLDPEGGAGAPLCFTRVTTSSGGRLTIRGPTVSGGAIETRDFGSLDPKGRLHVHGRSDAVFIAGGEKIAPEEIEAVLLDHPAIAEVVVVGAPDPRGVLRPIALLAARPAALRPEAESLSAWCRARLASFKVPCRFEWIESLPRGASGKISRHAAEQELARRSAS